VGGSEPGRNPLAFLPGALRYILHSEDFHNPGDLITPVPNWAVGETFSVGDGRCFRVLKIVPFLGVARYDAMWMVEQIHDAAETESPVAARIAATLPDQRHPGSASPFRQTTTPTHSTRGGSAPVLWAPLNRAGGPCILAQGERSLARV
jgi:hypothetical protein